MIIKIFISTILTLASFSTFSHSGGTIKEGELKGCHRDNKIESFHCHSSANPNLIGKEFLSKQDARNLLPSTTRVVSLKYNRKHFKHWIDTDKDCLNTRAEILQERSLSKVVIKGCLVKSGLWRDYYFDENLTHSSKIDIDHIVPLKEAWISGAKSWSPQKREDFANDSENLVITNLKYNRKKGAKTPLEWLPLNKEYACKYIKHWIFIKEKYQLIISLELLEQYKQMSCS